MAESLPGWHGTSCSFDGAREVHPLCVPSSSASWESVMFATGSPPFGTLSACYRYNPRSISVPKVWKCRHRRSAVPEEGKLEHGSPCSWLRVGKERLLLRDISIGMIKMENPLYLISALNLLEFMGWTMKEEFLVKGHCFAHGRLVQVSSNHSLRAADLKF